MTVFQDMQCQRKPETGLHSMNVVRTYHLRFKGAGDRSVYGLALAAGIENHAQRYGADACDPIEAGKLLQLVDAIIDFGVFG